MRGKMKNKLFLVFLLTALVLSACSTSNKIVGTWQDELGDIFEFYEDGTVVLNSSGMQVSGVYEFIDDDTLKLSLDGFWGIGGATIMDVEFSGRQMMITAYGETMVLEKIN
jgi:hypothetical protein